MNRNLDGVYFRMKRDDKWQNICFSDLSDSEMEEVMQDRPVEWFKDLCKILGHTIRDIGDQLDIAME